MKPSAVRTLVASAVAAAAVALLPAAPAAAATRKAERPCEQRGRTVARTAGVRLYERSRGRTHKLFGCHRRTGRPRLLDAWYSCECSVGDERPPRVRAVRGRFVALDDSYGCGPFPCEIAPSLRVLDLRAGRVHHAVAQGSASTGLLLKRNGALAYVLGERLIRLDATGEAVLDEGPGIDPLSLAATRDRLYWMHGEAPRTAPFS